MIKKVGSGLVGLHELWYVFPRSNQQQVEEIIRQFTVLVKTIRIHEKSLKGKGHKIIFFAGPKIQIY
jgi:hypothetical protein